jgi:tetratricopeptide (TPR) repeat protein
MNARLERRRARGAGLAGLVLGLVALAPASVHVRRALDEPHASGGLALQSVRRAADAALQLAHGEELVRAALAASDRERLRLRLSAVEALRCVRDWHEDSGDDGARAALLAAEHLGVLGLHGEALAECEAAVRLAADPRLSLQARLERAHAARRVGANARAAEDYRHCAALLVDAERCAALVRLGDVEYAAGRSEHALAAWEQAVAVAVPEPCTIDAYDRLARRALERDDPEAAAAWLERCARALAEPLRELTPRGTQLRRALVGMHTRHELACLALERVTHERALGMSYDE